MTPSVPFAPPARWELPPRTLLATYTDREVVVWQAHRAEVAERAVATGTFDGPSWRTDRTTRLRVSLPSLLWRCAWATRPGRERILAVRLRRTAFDELLLRAVPGDNDPSVYASAGAWRLATRFATALVSWHPDRDVRGEPQPWDTARFGLREALLHAFSREWVLGVEDVTPWVVAHRGDPHAPVPVVRPYPIPGGVDVR